MKYLGNLATISDLKTLFQNIKKNESNRKIINNQSKLYFCKTFLVMMVEQTTFSALDLKKEKDN